jgi:tRNA(Ile)-lysidine synthase
MRQLAEAFAAAMARLGPFGPAPRLAVAVSGGADSLALALLARDWARRRGGTALGLVADHGLRPGSAAEARITQERLAAGGIDSCLLPLAVATGPRLAERARAARYEALEAACAARGILDLLLGHHALDQAETVLMRAARASGPDGRAGMPALRESRSVRLLRPLLGIAPGRLRTALRETGMGWINDPSNAESRFERARIRVGLADPEGEGPRVQALVEAAAAAGRARATREADRAARLAAAVMIRPEGFALLLPGPLAPDDLAALLRTLSGAAYPIAPARVAALAAAPRPVTIGGVRLLAGGRLGPSLLAAREAAAMEPAVPAERRVWDGRFRLVRPPPSGLTLGALGPEAARLRRFSPLPAAVLRTLPALRRGQDLFAVPHLGYPDEATCALVPVLFEPAHPLAGAAFCLAG